MIQLVRLCKIANSYKLGVLDVIISSLSNHNMIRTMRKINHLKYPSRTIKCRNCAKYDHLNFVMMFQK